MIIQKDLKEILEVIVLTANVFGMFWKFLNWFFNYKISQWETKKQNKNRCASRNGKQR